MGHVALPFTLTADTKASATQVQQNLQALLNAINGALDHTNLKADSQSLSQVSNAILQIMQAGSGVGALNDAQIASGQQLVWGTDAAIYRIAAGVLGLKGGAGGTAQGPFVTAIGQNSGIKVEWGTSSVSVATAGTQVSSAVTFATAFTSEPLVLIAINNAGGGSAGYIVLIAGSVSATGFTAYANAYLAQAIGFSWCAIGN